MHLKIKEFWGFKMKTKYKKIVIAVETGVITSLICSALPTFASDVELYKAPQSSETTIMFMMDVSGSMDDESRLINLKRGMKKLLQGDVATGIEPLPDKLITGLADFSSRGNANGPFGRIQLEARPLGEETALPGYRAIYQTMQTFTQSAVRSNTEAVTRNDNNRTRIQNGRRSCDLWWDGTCYSWNNAQSTSGELEGWPVATNRPTSGWTHSQDGVVWSLTGNATATSGLDPKECIEWNDVNSTITNTTKVTCKTWEDTTKQLTEFPSLTAEIQESTPSYAAGSRVVNSEGTPSNGTVNSVSSVSPTNNSGWSCSGAITNSSGTRYQTCTRNQTGTVQTRWTRTYNQNGAATYTVTTTYYASGVVKDTHRKKMIRAVNALYADGGTPTAYAYAEVAAYLMGQTTTGVTDATNASGFTADKTNISGSTNYIAPTSITKTNQCNTQGIYFLTDGEPTYYNMRQSNVPKQYDKTVLENFMKKTLGNKASSFKCSNPSTLGSVGGYTSNSSMTKNGWDCVGAYTKALLNTNENEAGVSIKTAVVGFGSAFSGGNGGDVQEAQKWGTLGGGGWYAGSDDKAVVDSVLAFLKKLQKYIPPVTTGSVTVPIDNLDTQNIQPWGYFPQFDPQPDSRVTTWIGNLKKYEVKNNVLRDRNGNKVVDEITGVSVDDPNDFWADTSIKKTITKVKIVNGKETEEDIQVRIGGALSQLRLGLIDTNVERKIFTDRKINEDGAVATVGDNSNLLQVKTADLKVLNDTNNFVKDPKRGYLAALFGYDISSAMARQLETSSPSSTAQTTFTNFLTNTNATLRQMGAVMHSKPLLITQEGKTKFDAATGDLSYESRDDLIVFGTTQGLLHVVRAGKNSTDSDAGKEVFTFVPSEMIEKQHQGFLDQKQQGIDLKYGIDGPWTAYTEYATRSGTSATAPVVSVKNGKQWLYGGLRMGGRSYYALDLSDVTSTSGTPKIKFKIDPQSAAAYSPLSYMGQSWSKPTLTWVKWKGERKLVMLVGGGYDNAYENLNHRPSSSKDKGAGVYMFDADDGSLLWWASSNVDTTSVDATQVADMKRSVVSQIKAIDRNNDGLTDHLYFGDLGGQLWRVDLDSSNAAGDTANVAKRVVRILDMSSASKVPRFYSTPSFSIHNSGNGLFGVVTIGSGNLSFPMSESDQSDALYVVYDKDVTKRNLSVLKDSELSTVDVSTSGAGSKKLVENTNGNTSTSLTNGGWYYPLATKNRILNDNVVIANDLYTSVFDATVDIDDVNCYGGVRGKSVAKQFCLPFGQCLKKDDSGNDVSDERPDDIDLGLGNIGISFGGIDKKRGLVLNLPTDKPIKTYQGKSKFISQRWYEY